jgi:membrane associated rhomboid family serine protease
MLPIGDDNTTRRTVPIVTYLLILANVLVFLIELVGGDSFTYTWSFTPAYFLSDPGVYWITIFTSMFLHAGWMHLIGNMLYLWIFGDNVEDRMGHGRFLIFYLLCGLAATMAQLFATSYSDLGIPNLGASGAIAGVLASYLILFPRQRVRVFVIARVIPMSSFIVIGIWFLLQIFSQLGSTSSDGVAYMAHIGGFIAGLLLTFVFRKRVVPPQLPYNPTYPQ